VSYSGATVAEENAISQPQGSPWTTVLSLNPKTAGRSWVPHTKTSTVKQIDNKHSAVLTHIVKKERTCIVQFGFVNPATRAK
jgi:hypothetical protein